MTAPRQHDEAIASAIAYSKVAAGVMKTFRQNRSKLKGLTEAELIAALARVQALVDQPFQDIDIDLAVLGFDDDINIDIEIDLEAEAETYANSAAVCDVRRTLAPASSKTSLSGSTPITIRIPGVVLAAIKVKAQEMGVPYQTLINRSLRLAVVG